MFIIKGKYTSALIMLRDESMLDKATREQIYAMVSHPAFTNPIVIMPDCHKGSGSVIGFTMKLGKFVVPNVVGVDIGCGMLLLKFSHDRDDLRTRVADIDKAIRAAVPMGAGEYCNKYFGDMDDVLSRLQIFIRVKLSEYRKACPGDTKFNNVFNKALAIVANEKVFTEKFLDKCNLPRTRFLESLGTLGGGNHFIELGELDGRYCITIHTGSRQVGLKVADAYQRIAKKKLIESGEKWSFDLNEAAYLVGEDSEDYLAAMIIAQTYAFLNRMAISHAITESLDDIGIKTYDNNEELECIHNFIDFTDGGTIRKGAISSQAGEMLIVPLSSAAGIILGIGKGNPEWNCSAPHGAGRVLSRSQANRDLTAEQIAEAMDGVYASCTPADESPLAYKDPEMIIEAVAGTMNIVGIVKPFLSIKSGKSDEH
jgi:RNA-splicing ligase RtcB